MTTNAEQRFSCDPTLPSRARDWVRATLSRALPDGADRSLVDDVEIVISELTTNAIRARCTTSTVRWDLKESVVTVSVVDDGAGWPRPVAASPEAQQGRGLQIVGALARAWGVSRDVCGKRTWAQLALTGT
jgi:anti-sigma regulatory factor (Ser/Thr protein kinase)